MNTDPAPKLDILSWNGYFPPAADWPHGHGTTAGEPAR